MIERGNTEIQKKNAEGTSDVKIYTLDVSRFLHKEGYHADNIDIWYDNMQGIWRWSCCIVKYNKQF